MNILRTLAELRGDLASHRAHARASTVVLAAMQNGEINADQVSKHALAGGTTDTVLTGRVVTRQEYAAAQALADWQAGAPVHDAARLAELVTADREGTS